MLPTTSRPRLTGAQLALIVLLLITQFMLRTHHTLKQPAFVDENYHVRRGEIVYRFDQNPIEFANGKLLFYYWLGAFAPTGDSALADGRLAVAVFSLITSAGAATVARALFGRRALLPALALYALAPYAVFFERMALADPFAGGLATLTICLSIRLARSPQPTRRLGALTGLLLGMTTLAKLTTLPMLAMPILTAALLGPIRPMAWNRAALRAWIRALWRCYRPAWMGIAVTVGILWSLFFSGMIAYRVSGEQPKFFTQKLVHDAPGDLGLLDSVWDTLVGAGYFLTVFAVILLAALIGLLLWRRTKAGGLALIWLVALWTPVIVLGNPVQTRYLMAGVPALAVLFGGGCAVLFEIAPPRYHAQRIVAAAISLWALAFALPFAWRASTDPDSLRLPKNDIFSYISGPYAGWGTRDALEYLIANGERVAVPVEGREEPVWQIPAVGVLQHCGSISLHVTQDFIWSCIDTKIFPIGAIPADVRQWGPLMEGVETWPFVYLVTEFAGRVPDDLHQEWELIYASPRPLGGWTVAVWRVTAQES
jgi:hypothetical protein